MPAQAPQSRGRPKLLVLCAWGLLGCSHSTSGAAQVPSPPQERCVAPGRWLGPVPLVTPDGRPLYVEQPDPVGDRRGITLIGQPTWVWATNDQFAVDSLPDRNPISAPAMAGVVVQNSGVATALLVPPSTAGQMLAVRAIGDSGGLVHVLWGSPGKDSVNGRLPVTSLWYSQLVGTRWGEPELVLESDDIEIGRTTVAFLKARGTVHVAAIATDQSHSAQYRKGIRYARRSLDGRWVNDWVSAGPLDPTVRYVTLFSAGQRQELFVAFTGRVNVTPTESMHGLHTVQASIGGTWSALQTIQELPSGSGYFLDATQDGRGFAHLAWVTQPETHDAGPTIQHVVTKDGVRWHSTPSLNLPQAMFDQAALASLPDGVRLAIRARDARDIALWSWQAPHSDARPDTVAWKALPKLELTGIATPLTLGVLGTDSLVVTWGIPHAVTNAQGLRAYVPAMQMSLFIHCS